MKQIKKTDKILLVIFFIFSFEAILFFIAHTKLEDIYFAELAREDKIKKTLVGTSIIAKAISIYNITQNKKIYSKNDGEAFPIASLAKILTVTQSLNTHERDQFIYISREAIDQAGDFGMFAHEKWKVLDLAKLTLIASVNDGAHALSEQDENFIENLNNKAKRIGAQNTFFINSSGLDLDLEHAGAFASASDVNIMAMYALKAYPEIFSATILPEINLKSDSGFEHNFKNTNILIGKIPNLLFSKTGYTEIAQGNLVIIFKDKKGEEIAITLLGSTFEGRFDDMEKIVSLLNVY